MEFHNSNYAVALCMLVFLIHHNFGPQPIRALIELNALVKPPPLTMNPKPVPARFSSRHMKMEDSHNRPTTPGNSPGMGHNNPPGAANKP